MRDRIVKKMNWQIDMQAGTVTGFAVSVHRAPVPYCLQRIDGRSDNAPRRLAVDCSHKPNART